MILPQLVTKEELIREILELRAQIKSLEKEIQILKHKNNEFSQ